MGKHSRVKASAKHKKQQHHTEAAAAVAGHPVMEEEVPVSRPLETAPDAAPQKTTVDEGRKVPTTKTASNGGYPSSAPAEEVQHLRTLNGILAKQMEEGRQESDQDQGQVSLSEIERAAIGTALASHLSEAGGRLTRVTGEKGRADGTDVASSEAAAVMEERLAETESKWLGVLADIERKKVAAEDENARLTKDLMELAEEKTEVEKTLRTAEAEGDAIRGSLQDARKALEGAREENQWCKKELQSLVLERDEARNHLCAQTGERKALEIKISNLESRREETKRVLDLSLSRCRALEQESEVKEAAVASLTEEKTSLEKDLQSLVLERDEARNHLCAQTGERKALEIEISNLENRHEETKRALDLSLLRCRALEQESEVEEAAVASLTKEKTSLEKDLRSLVLERDEAREHLCAQTEERKAIEIKISSLENRHEETKRDLDLSLSRCRSLEQESDVKEAAVASLTGEKTSLEKRLSASIQMVDDLRSKMDEAVRAKDEAVKSVLLDRDETRHCLHLQRQEMKGLVAKAREAAEEVLRRALSECQPLEETAAEWRRDLESLEDGATSVESVLGDALRFLNKLNGEMAKDAQVKGEKLERTKTEMEKVISVKGAECEDLSKLNSSFISQLVALRDEHGSLKAERDHLRSQVAELSASNGIAQKMLESLHAELKKQAEEKEQDTRSHQSLVEGYLQQIEELEREMKAAAEERALSDRSKSAMEQERGISEKEKGEQRDKIFVLQELVANLNSELAAQKELFDNQTRESEGVQERLGQQTQKVEELVQELKELEKSKSAMEQERVVSEKEKSEQRDKNFVLQELVANLNSELAAQKELSDSQTRESEGVQERLGQQTQKVEELVQELKELEKSKSAMEQERGVSEKEKGEQRDKIFVLQELVANLNSELAAQKDLSDNQARESEGVQERLGQQTQKVEELVQELKELEKSKSAMEQERGVSEKEKGEQRDKIFVLQELVANLNSELAAQKDLSDNQARESEALRAEKKGVQEQQTQKMEELVQESKELEKSKSAMEQELGELQRVNAQLLEEKEEIERRVDALGEERSCVGRSLAVAVGRLEKAEKMVGALQKLTNEALTMMKKAAAEAAWSVGGVEGGEGKAEEAEEKEEVVEVVDARPFAAEVEAIRRALGRKEEEMARQRERVEGVQRANASWKWVSSAMAAVSTTALAWALAAKGR